MSGSLRKALVIMRLSSERSKHGRKMRLLIIAINRVTEINIPSAEVPPKLEAVKIKNPENKITAV